MVQYPLVENNHMNRKGSGTIDWNNEVMPQPMREQGSPYWGGQPMGMQSGTETALQPPARLDLRNTVSDETVESPLSTTEAYLGSLKAMLQRNRGNYIVATFLIGTQSTVSFEGLLYEVGNDFITIYQEGRQRYIVVDMYSLKYIEFYDTRGRAMCQAMLQESGNWQMR